MKRHAGWIIRTLIAAVGVGYILYTLDWSDRVWLPPGYVAAEGIAGGEDGRAYRVLDDSEIEHLLVTEDGSHTAAIAKSELGTGDDQPQFKPSFITILSRADATRLVGGGLLFIPIVSLAALRWWVLMRARGIPIGYARVGRLAMAGYFFNLCMPGTTGGDVMKAYYAAKGTDRRADAVVSIAIDRLCGLVGLVVVVGLIGLLSLDDPLIRRITIAMWVGLSSLIVGAGLYTSPALRRRLRLGSRLHRLPFATTLRNLDAWFTAYRQHLVALGVAVAIAVVIHLCLAGAMSLAGFALGVDQPLAYLLGTIPIVLMLWSLPVSGPLGLGPLDYVAVQLVVGTSDTSDQAALMMFVAFRLYLVAVGLIGSLAMLGLGRRDNDEPTMQPSD
ncbi:MAG: lysylphosphatidylglycerol synthase transmembrane domain-containing protein [Phycisphaeraceae bacterium]